MSLLKVDYNYLSHCLCNLNLFAENMVATLWLLSLLTVTLIRASECVYATPPLVKYQRLDNIPFGIQVSRIFIHSALKFTIGCMENEYVYRQIFHTHFEWLDIYSSYGIHEYNNI